MAVGEGVLVHLRLDVELLHALGVVQPAHLDFVVEVADVADDGLRACWKIPTGAAARDFGRSQGGEAGASPQRAVRAEPTQAANKRPAARRVFAEKAVWAALLLSHRTLVAMLLRRALPYGLFRENSTLQSFP